MSYGGIKEYHLIHLDFGKNICGIYHYLKDRRLTASQAWQIIHKTEPDLKIRMSNHDTISFFDKAVNDLNYDVKRCDRYMTFKVT